MSYTLHTGDSLAVLRTLPEASVHCVVTSPPYWRMRDYGVDGQYGLEPTIEDTFATRMAAAGVPVTTLAKILGHSSLRMVMKYVHPTQGDVAEAMRRYETASVKVEKAAEGRVM